jgi:two-component system OmpR family response regulator
MRVLMVEDEVRLADTVRRGLTDAGFVVELVHDGEDAVWAATENSYDVIVLDIMLPKLNGYKVLEQLRDRGVWTPVLMLTAKDGEYDQTDAFDLGADDYLTKPFSMRELVARVHALLRRVRRAAELARDGEAAPVQRIGDLEIDRSGRRVRRAGTAVHLTPLEFDLLACLAQRPAQVLTREQLLAQVWDWADASGTRTVDSHVKAVRRKLGGDVIRTVHGIGYAVGG